VCKHRKDEAERGFQARQLRRAIQGREIAPELPEEIPQLRQGSTRLPEMVRKRRELLGLILAEVDPEVARRLERDAMTQGAARIRPPSLKKPAKPDCAPQRPFVE
jgi:hypothetical protein